MCEKYLYPTQDGQGRIKKKYAFTITSDFIKYVK